MRRIVFLLLVTASLAATAGCFDQVAYPIIPVSSHSVVGLDEEGFIGVSAEDEDRLAIFTDGVSDAVAAFKSDPLLEVEDFTELAPSERAQVMREWAAVVDYAVGFTAIVDRYRAWFLVDYIRYPALHAKAFALCYAAYLERFVAIREAVEAVRGNDLWEAALDDAVPELGLQAGTFSMLRNRIANPDEYSWVTLGDFWYDTWIEGLVDSPALRERVDTLSTRAKAQLLTSGLTSFTYSSTEIARDGLYKLWFPVFLNVAEWMGDTRVKHGHDSLISEDQVCVMQTYMRPGDIIVERRNWYLSNIGLPGFWPHAALYTGTADEILREFGSDPAVLEFVHLGGARTVEEHLNIHVGEAWRALPDRGEDGRPFRVLEAVSEGVVFNSLEHSCLADYVGVMRPNLSRLARYQALLHAFAQFGKPYDFDFDFNTDDSLVCSELVVKSYAEDAGKAGLHFEPARVMGRNVVTPNDIVAKLDAELGTPSQELSFIYFLDGREAEEDAVPRGRFEFRQSHRRAKWDISQP